MAETLTIRTASSTEVVKIAVPGPQGPKGDKGDPGDVAGLPLTTQGDTLYRGASQNERLPIGTSGQVLKVSAGGIPEWGNESGAVTSVNGETGAVVLDAADVGAAPATGISPSAITGTAVVDSDPRLSDSRTPSSHSSSHASAGSDPLAPSDIGAQSIFVTEALGTVTANVTLTAARAKIYTLNTTTSGLRILLPASDVLAGDIVQIRFTSSTGQSLTPVRGSMTGFFTSDIGPAGGPVTFIAASASGTSWAVAPVDRHVHGNIGDQGNIGTTSGLPIKTGTSGVLEAGAFGGSAGQFAEGNHTHADLHTRSHAITSTSDHTAGNHKVFYSNGSGEIVELALGNSGEVLTSNGATSAPSFAAASGGGVTTGSVDNAILRADGTGGSTSQSSDIVIDDATTSTQNNVALRNNHSETNSALVLTPKGTGAFIVGPKPDGTSTGGNARGSGAICIQTSRNAATQVASTTDSIAIGNRSTSSSSLGESVAIGPATTASGSYSTCVGGRATATGTYCTSLGHDADATSSGATALGNRTSATNTDSIAIGSNTSCGGAYAAAIGREVSVTAPNAFQFGSFLGANSATSSCGFNIVPSVRAQFATLPFSAVYWGGQTTTNAATVLNLDATATSRFTIAANTALAVDILLVARRSDTADKWLVARRFLGIRRDGSNNTSLIGTVQDYGLDQSAGSPSWTFALTADDTNEALQLEVTGATSETVVWRATAFYRVV